MKSRLENQKMEQYQKYKTLQDLFGLPYKIEEILEAPIGSSIYKEVKKIKESKERANNLQKQNQQFEEKIQEMERYIEMLNIENRETRERQSHTTLAYMKKVEALKEDKVK